MKQLLLAFLILFGAIPPILSQDINVSDNPEQCVINNGDLVTFTFNVSPPNLTDVVTNGTVSISFDFYHSWASDVQIILCAPDGTTCATIKTFDTNSSNDYGNADGSTYGSPATYTISGAGSGTLDDTGDQLPGAYAPVQAFSIFNGVAANGNWTLTLADDAGGDDGCIQNVTLQMDVEELTAINNGCDDAIALTVTADGTCSNQTLGTNESATASGETPTPNCSSFGTGEDVWYSVTVPETGAVTIEMKPETGGPTDWGMQVLSGSCGALSQVECDDDDGDGLFPLIALVGRTPGEVLLVRVFEYANNETGQFNICAHYEPVVLGCGGTWTDSGGSGADYSDDENETITFCPDTPGDVVHVNFTAFSTENQGASNCYDGLTIHNGDSDAASTIPSPGGSVDIWCWDRDDATPAGTGDLQDRTIVSTDASGCLTFVFTSDGSVQREGWEAAISCNAPTCPPTNIISQTAGEVNSDAVCITGDGWHHFYNASSNEVLVSLELGNTGAQIPITGATVNASGTGVLNLGTNGCEAPYAVAPDWFIMKRTWDVAPQIQPASDVSIRFYYNNDDFLDINSALGDIGSHTDLTHYKINIDEEDLTVPGNDCHDMVDPSNYIEFDSGEYTHSVLAGTAHYAQYNVASFSGGGGGGGTAAAGALPVVLVNFESEVEKTGNYLKWVTSSEENAKTFIVERSTTGIDEWVGIGHKPAIGYSTSLQHYGLMDTKPLALAYYRLKMIDFDDSFEYSNIIQIKRPTEGNISIYPNPSRDLVHISYTARQAGSTKVVINHLNGQIVYVQEVNLTEGIQSKIINIDHLPNGVYILSMIIDEQHQIQRLVKN